MSETKRYYLQAAGDHVFVDVALHDGNALLCEPVDAVNRTVALKAFNNVIRCAEVTRDAIRQIALRHMQADLMRQISARTAPAETPRHEGIFNSAHEALVFAFNFKSQQYPRTPMTQLLAGSALGSGRGLVGVDGAGQAGMVLREVLDLPPDQRAIIIGRFSKPIECPCCGGDAPSADYNEALAHLATILSGPLAGTTCDFRIRRELARKYMNGKVSMAMLAEATGMPRRTLTDHYRKVAATLAPLEKRARAALDDLLASMVVNLA